MLDDVKNTVNQFSGVQPLTIRGWQKPRILHTRETYIMEHNNHKHYDTIRRTAILIDGGFYRSVAYSIWGDISPQQRADELYDYCMKHLNNRHEYRDLYRIFYYDCLPSSKTVYNPLSKAQVKLSQTPLFAWMNEFIEILKSKRKFAVRLGELSEDRIEYHLKYAPFKKLCTGTMQVSDLCDNDLDLSIEQKGVDMKIGIDIASLAYKKQVDQIIFISGDSDFVPAAKLARREGIDFILDPMGRHIKDSLNEHIDGIQSRVSQMSPSDTSRRFEPSADE